MLQDLIVLLYGCYNRYHHCSCFWEQGWIGIDIERTYLWPSFVLVVWWVVPLRSLVEMISRLNQNDFSSVSSSNSSFSILRVEFSSNRIASVLLISWLWEESKESAHLPCLFGFFFGHTFPLSWDFGTLAGGLGSFPLDHGAYPP